MQTISQNTAFAPLSTAAQMAADAAEHMTEAERLAFAISVANQANQKASIASLRRLSAAALTTVREIDAAQMADRLSPASRIDPAFWRIFLSFYNHTTQPTIAMAYRHACLLVRHKNRQCLIASEQAVRHALTELHCASRATPQDRSAN